MSLYSSLVSSALGRLCQAEAAIRKGLELAFATEGNLDKSMTQLLAGEHGRAALQDLAFRFALAPLVAEGKALDLGEGWAVKIDEVLDLNVDYSLSVEEIDRRMQNKPIHRIAHSGAVPIPGLRLVRALRGHLNQEWNFTKIDRILARPNCPVTYSGAWVREAFAEAFTMHENRGVIFFPETPSCTWCWERQWKVPGQWEPDQHRAYPDFFSQDRGDVHWRRGFDSDHESWMPWYSLCFLLREGVELPSRKA